MKDVVLTVLSILVSIVVGAIGWQMLTSWIVGDLPQAQKEHIKSLKNLVEAQEDVISHGKRIEAIQKEQIDLLQQQVDLFKTYS